MENLTIKAQQSVLLALDSKTGTLIEASELLKMDEESLRSLRRDSLDGLPPDGTCNTEARLRCALCDGPVHISMQHREFGNRWFAHHGPPTKCPYRTESRMSFDDQKAWQYQGQQEGAEHKRLKHFIADYLEQDPTWKKVLRDKVRPSELRPGEWKRPDVRAVSNDREIVFEIQLSYEFLSEIIRRDNFYRQEGVYIFWIFREFALHREALRDELFFNRRNIFVLDAEAERETIKNQRLTLKCYYQKPVIENEKILETWGKRYVQLNQLAYPETNYRPYYLDFNEARLHQLRGRVIRSIRRWDQARRQSDRELTGNIFRQTQEAWRKLVNFSATDLSPSFIETDFLTIHLPRLLSIKYCRAIGYNYKTVWEVLNAALLMPSRSIRPFDILYLMAIDQYKANLKLSTAHDQRIQELREEIKKSIIARNPRFRRDCRFDRAIEIILPELAQKLKSRFGV